MGILLAQNLPRSKEDNAFDIIIIIKNKEKITSAKQVYLITNIESQSSKMIGQSWSTQKTLVTADTRFNLTLVYLCLWC